jgi:hypothetical protein
MEFIQIWIQHLLKSQLARISLSDEKSEKSLIRREHHRPILI